MHAAHSTRPWAALVTTLSLIVGGLALLLGTATAASAAQRDMDCGDFANQRDAQLYFLDHGGPQEDPDRLDADGDGVACDSNPCPCYTGSSEPDDGGGQPAHQGANGGKTLRQSARVVRVVDGDTVLVRVAGRGQYVRLIGIDSPEDTNTVECGGPEATAALAARLHPRDRVRLVSDPSQDRTDRYGRLLRYVIKQGRDLNRRQVRTGNATVYVYDDTPFKRTRAYRSAQRQAQAADRGLWSHC